MNKLKYTLLFCSLLSFSFSPSLLEAMKRPGPEQTSFWDRVQSLFKKRKIHETEIQLTTNMGGSTANTTVATIPAATEVVPVAVHIQANSNGNNSDDEYKPIEGSVDAPIDLDTYQIPINTNSSTTSSVKTEEKDEVTFSGLDSTIITTMSSSSSSSTTASLPSEVYLDLAKYLSSDAREKFQSLIRLLPANFQKTGEIISMILALFAEESSARLNTEISKKIEQESGDVKKDISAVRAEVAKQLGQLRQQLEASFSEAKKQFMQEAIEQREQIMGLHNNVSALKNKQKINADSVGSKLNELAKNQQELKKIQGSFGEKQNVRDSRVNRAIVVGTLVFAGTTFVLYLPFVGGATFFSAITGGMVASLTSVGGSWIFYSIRDVLDSIKSVRNKLSDCSIL